VELLVVVLSLYHRGFIGLCKIAVFKIKRHNLRVSCWFVVLRVNSQWAYPSKVAHPFRAINSPHRRCTNTERGGGEGYNFSLPTRGLALPASESDPAKRAAREKLSTRYTERARHACTYDAVGVCRGVRYVRRWFDIRYTFTIAQAIDRPPCTGIALSRTERILRCCGLCTRLGTHPRE